MTLQNGMALARLRVPDAHAGVQTTRRDPLAVERDRVDLAEVAGQRPQTAPLGDVPDLRGCVVAARDDEVAVDP